MPHWIPYKRKTNFPLIVSGGVFTAATFAADLMTPLGVAGGVPYIGAVLIGFLIPGKKYIIAASVSGSILTILAFLLLPYPENIEVWGILVNRGFALFAIWCVAILGLYYKNAEKEIQKRTRLDRLLRISAVASNEISNFEQAARICLSNICKSIGCEVGHLYQVDEKSNRLFSTKIWSLSDPDRFKIFQSVTEQTYFEPGIGLPGRVFASGKPAWIPDVYKDSNFPRAKLAKDLGVKSGVAFPVETGSRVVAVLEFFSKQNLALDPLLMETLENIGAQLGRVFEREQAYKDIEKHKNQLEELVKSRTQELDKSLQRSKSYFETPLVGLLVSAPGRGFIEVNERICEMTGYARDELLGMAWEDITHPDDLEKETNLFLKLFSGEIERYLLDKRYIRKDKSTIYVGISVGCVKKADGDPDYFVAMVQDISDRKKIEVEKERLSQMKTDFLSTAAHELRTPLTTIRGFSELIITRDDFSEEQKIEFSKLINEESENLAGIIDDLLDISRIEAGISFSLNIKLASLAVSVKRETDAMKRYDSGHKYPLEIIGRPYEILMDPEKIRQVLKNIYGNSVKYSEAGCEISTKIVFNDDAVLVSVSDKGHGMNSDQTDHIFDKFFRAEEKKNIQGTGLGMTIVKYLIEAHGGKVRVESAINMGTTVTFEIPKISPVWRDEFSVNIPPIDDQHRALFDLIRKMAISIRDGEGRKTIDLILTELEEYAELHFKYEEGLLEKYYYPDISNHKKMHGYYKDRIQNYNNSSEDEKQRLPLEITAFLYSWLMSHILKEDMAYSSFLISKGVNHLGNSD